MSVTTILVPVCYFANLQIRVKPQMEKTLKILADKNGHNKTSRGELKFCGTG